MQMSQHSQKFLETTKKELHESKGDRADGEGGQKQKNNFSLQEAITSSLNKMHKDKVNDETKKIPVGFDEFVQSQQYKDLLQAMLDYNRELFRLENKQQVLEQEARQRGLPIPQVLPSEKKKLSEKAKKMADKYSWIVFTHTSIGSKGMGKNNSFMQFKKEILMNQKADKAFYEAMMTFSTKVLSNAFDKNDNPKLEEEVSRLFRSSAFNISTRTQHEEQRKKKYACLKEA
jgi:hypothetical protein